MSIAALAWDPDDFLVDNDRPRVLARYAEYVGGDVEPPVESWKIPDHVWELAELDEANEEDDGDEG